MNWRECTIEVVTHCICAGANQEAAEIRVPSIRGQVRWWFRALGGNREEEKQLFGGVHGDAQRSNVIFRLKETLSSNLAQNLYELVGTDQNKPQAYLLWPLRPTQRSPQRRGMIPPGGTFVLQYALRPLLAGHPLVAKMQASLEAWILLGSIGTRSRRGFGSIAPVEADSAPDPSLEDLGERVKRVMAPFGRPDIKVMLLSGANDNAGQALDFLGNWLKTFRAGSQKSGVTPSRWGKQDHDVGLEKPGTLTRPVLGLPLTQRYTHKRIETELKGAQRWASPVHLKVLKWGGGFYPLAVFFRAMAMPEGTRVTLESPGRSVDVPVDHSLFREMMNPGRDALVLWDA